MVTLEYLTDTLLKLENEMKEILIRVLSQEITKEEVLELKKAEENIFDILTDAKIAVMEGLYSKDASENDIQKLYDKIFEEDKDEEWGENELTADAFAKAINYKCSSMFYELGIVFANLENIYSLLESEKEIEEELKKVSN